MNVSAFVKFNSPGQKSSIMGEACISVNRNCRVQCGRSRIHGAAGI